jgi:hypothetical protein
MPPVSQQSWALVHGSESPGLQLPHSPFWVPLRTQATLCSGFAAQSASASPVTALASQATQALPAQSGFFALPVQSLSDVHSTQCPVVVLQTGVAARPLHWSSAVQGKHARLPFESKRQSGLAGSSQPSSVVGLQLAQRSWSTQ